MRAKTVADQRRVCGRCSKKLRRAFRWRLTEEGNNDWLADLAAENPDEATFIQVKAAPEEARAEAWHGLYFRAWEDLRFDRFYGAMGGEAPISYVAMSRFAEDHGIRGEEFAQFRRFLQAIDAEWIAFTAENAEA
ncbi:hypothetical protein G6K93_05740 [Agrobacterium rhizogenes]|nr:hypothetical protein [Rhizobium rhizogenes]